MVFTDYYQRGDFEVALDKLNGFAHDLQVNILRVRIRAVMKAGNLGNQGNFELAFQR